MQRKISLDFSGNNRLNVTADTGTACRITAAGRVRDGTAASTACRSKDEFSATKIVILPLNDDRRRLWKTLKCGVSGFLLKNSEADEFLDLLVKLANDEIILSAELTGRLLEKINCPAEVSPVPPPHNPNPEQPLTPRQREVLNQVARGLTYREIAAALQISESTVKYHMNEVLRRFHVETRSQAIAYAAENHLTK